MTPAATILTPIPSPYQVELWDAVNRDGSVRPRVAYLNRTHPDRQWHVPSPAHEHVYLEDGPEAVRTATGWVRSADLFVASWYTDIQARALIAERVASKKPWVYWGERPGYSRWRLVGRLRRRWWLAAIRNSDVPIWGVGAWGIDGWKYEFGERRSYVNFPYFSDLSRFAPPPDCRQRTNETRFLYSGALIPRKGVDLLAEAFLDVARARPHVRLEIVGGGELKRSLQATLRGLGGQVTFADFVPWAALPAAYHRSDVLVAPSRYDGWGLIVPEGLAAGLAVIGTDRTGAARELIRRGENGWLIAAGSVDQLRTAMAEAADLPVEKRAAMRATAQAGVARHQLSDGVARFVAATSAVIGWPK